MTALCLYFGTEMPDREWARSLAGADVVLEPYHPLVKDGGFADIFPDCQRYVYVNPTSVDPWILGQSKSKPPLIGRDGRWDLPRLDLSTPEGFNWAVAEALTALAADGGRGHGLFVDDLDRLLPEQTEIAMSYLVHVTVRHGKEPGWFLNRAFSLWPLVEGLDAVLLEDITPALIGYESVSGVRWVREVVLQGVRQVRARGIHVHSIGYSDHEKIPEGRIPDPVLTKELAELVDSVTTGADRRLEEWRVSK